MFRLQGQLIWQRFCQTLLNLMLRFCYYALECKMRAQRSQAYTCSCTFMFMCVCLSAYTSICLCLACSQSYAHLRQEGPVSIRVSLLVCLFVRIVHKNNSTENSMESRRHTGQGKT